MLTMIAQVVNVFRTPEGTNKQGEKYGGETKVQMQGKQELKNGQSRIELFTMTISKPDLYQKLIGNVVQVPVGVFAGQSGVGYFIPHGAVPKAVSNQG